MKDELMLFNEIFLFQAWIYLKTDVSGIIMWTCSRYLIFISTIRRTYFSIFLIVYRPL